MIKKDLSRVYSSFLVDCHITEHDETFLTQFDPATYVEAIKKTGADSAIVYACCHNGNCHYPTQVGHMHRNLKGRDIFGETIDLLRRADIIPRAYYTVVYQRNAARNHPDWRVTLVDGSQNYRRSWYNCPNSPGYRAFVNSQVAEIAAYDIASLFIDMTFWPGVCVCQSCRERYLNESSLEIPKTVDWNNPVWVRFQRSRERWLAEFAHEITRSIKNVNDNVAVAHQFSPAILGWMYGQSPQLAMASDKPSGDFYGGKHQQRMGTKVLAAFSKEHPFEFMASRCVSLYDHTSNKSLDELMCSCATTLANGGGYLLIDAINPSGTLEQSFYERVQVLATTIEPFKRIIEKHRPAIEANIGLYFSMASQVRRDHNGLPLASVMNPANNMLAASDLRPMQELLGTSANLNLCKMPYRVLTGSMDTFDGIDSIIINDAAYLSAEEVQRLRQFVYDGGCLLATGLTSFYDLNGETHNDFALKDVLGVTFSGRFTTEPSYAVSEGTETVSCKSSGPVVDATTASVVMHLAEPLFDPNDFEHFASYHSNPPGSAGRHAALTVNNFGRGRAIYLYSSILATRQDAQQQFASKIFRTYLAPSLIRHTNAPHSVELTLLRSTTADVLLLCFVNFQDELPNIPLSDLEVTIALPRQLKAMSCRQISSGGAIAFSENDGFLTLTLKRLETIEILEIKVRSAK